MKIGIDASALTKSKKTGIEYAAQELIRHLIYLPTQHNFILYSPQKLPSDFSLPANAISKVIPLKRMWHKLRLPLELLRSKPDALLVPSYSAPAFSPQNTCTVIHDLAYEYFPSAYSKKEIALQRKALNDSIHRSAKLIFVSKSTRDDFFKFHDFPKSKTRVILSAFNNQHFGKNALSAKSKRGMPKRYVLFVGRLEERKNIERIIDAFSIYRQENEDPCKLVLIGQPGYGFERIVTKLASLGKLKNDILLPGYVKYSDLPAWYANASAFIFPSLYEGFGIPVLEAFACGVPVITSNTSSLPEVAGRAAVLIDPTKPEEVSKALTKILTDNNFAITLKKEGIERAKEFSWDKTAKETLAFLLE